MKWTDLSKKFILKFILVFLAVLFLEAVCFNYDAIVTGALAPVAVEFPESSSDGEYKTVEVTGLDLDTRTLKLAFTGPDMVTDVTVEIKDDARREKYTVANSLHVVPYDDKYNEDVVRLKSNGKLRAIRLVWLENEAEVSDIEVNVPIPYYFSFLRFFTILAVAVFVLFVKEFDLTAIVWDHKNKKHIAGYALIVCLSVLAAFGVNRLMTPRDPALSTLFSRPASYPLENIEQYQKQAHVLILDAFLNKSLNIRVEPDSKLLEVDNPYDISQRAKAGASYMYDYVLFEGKYYSYFGVTPVLLFFLPWYLIFGNIPSYFVASFFFAVATAVGGYLCFWEAAKRFAGKISLVLFYTVAAAAVLGSNFLQAQTCADRYYLCIASMQAFFYLVIWTALKAVSTQKQRNRCLWLILCGICTFLLAWSRPMGIVAVVGWVAPLFIFVLIDKKRGIKGKAADVVSFIIPVALGASVILAYNNLRYSMPLEFGQFYQLTVEDTHYNDLYIEGLLPSIWYFFLDGIKLKTDFPWLLLTNDFINHSGNYFFFEENAGVFTMPIVWGLFLLPFNRLRQSGERTAVYITSLAAVIAVGFMDYCIAGMIYRYTLDILPTVCMLGGLLLLSFAGEDNGNGTEAIKWMTLFICLLTFITVFCLVFSNERNNICLCSPDRYMYFVRNLSLTGS